MSKTLVNVIPSVVCSLGIHKASSALFCFLETASTSGKTLFFAPTVHPTKRLIQVTINKSGRILCMEDRKILRP